MILNKTFFALSRQKEYPKLQEYVRKLRVAADKLKMTLSTNPILVCTHSKWIGFLHNLKIRVTYIAGESPYFTKCLWNILQTTCERENIPIKGLAHSSKNWHGKGKDMGMLMPKDKTNFVFLPSPLTCLTETAQL